MTPGPRGDALTRGPGYTARFSRFAACWMCRDPAVLVKLICVLGMLATVSLAIAIRAPAAVVAYLDVDDGAFVSIAAGMQRGQLMYRDLVDHKPPGIEMLLFLMFTVFGGNIPAARLGYVVVVAASCFPVWLLAQRAVSPRAGLFAALLFALNPLSVAWSPHLTQDGLMSSILAWSSYVFARSSNEDRASLGLVGAGLLAGLAFLVKQPAALILAVYGVFLLLSIPGSGGASLRTLARSRARSMGLVVAGFMVGYMPVVSFYWARGGLPDYLEFVFGVNALTPAAALSHAPEVWRFLTSQFAAIAAALVVLGPLTGSTGRRPGVTTLCAAWSLIYIIFLLLYEMLYPHYYLMTLPALSVMGGIGLARASDLVIRLLLISAKLSLVKGTASWARGPGEGAIPAGRSMVLAGFLLVCVGYASAPVLQSNIHELAASLAGWHRGPLLAEDRAVATEIEELTSRDDAILVLGNPAFYKLSDRRPATRYLYYSWRYVESPIHDEYLGALSRAMRSPSTKLVLVADAYRSLVDPSLLQLLDQEYEEVARIPYSYHGAVGFYKRTMAPKAPRAPVALVGGANAQANLAWVRPPWPNISADQYVPVVIKVRNIGQATWPGEGSEGDKAVRLGSLWLTEGNRRIGEQRVRFLDSSGLAPGASVSRSFELQAPSEPGTYRLVIQLLQEHVAWFPYALRATVRVEPPAWYRSVVLDLRYLLFSIRHGGR